MEPETGPQAKKPEDAHPRQRFAHAAMNARFEMVISSDRADYARQASQAAFNDLDKVEESLSYFVPSSDISRINRLSPGGWAKVDIQTMECLQVAARVSRETGGAFDPTIRCILECWKPRGRKETVEPSAEALAEARARTGMNLVVIDEDQYAVGVKAKGVKLDLGAIGKGYGLDRMGAVLREWELDRAMCHGAWSTALALNAPPDQQGWPMAIGDEDGKTMETQYLAGRAISRSGQEFGVHIFDPRTGRPALGKMGAWSLAPTGAEADALSTAFLVMTVEEVEAYCAKHKNIGALIIVEKDKKPTRLRFNWPKGA
jgi:FAD:protein FMN transferase